MPSSTTFSRSFAPVLVLLAAVAGTACTHVPQGQQGIDTITIKGTDAIDEGDVEDKIATEATSKFFGLFRGVVYDYSLYNPAALQKDLARIERYYRARGYYSAHARAGRVLQNAPGHVRIEILIEEGPPTVNDETTIKGGEGLPPPVLAAVKEVAKHALKPGKPFDEDDLPKLEDGTKKALTDAGYAYATVARESFLDVVRHVAHTDVTVTPGQTATLGVITMTGLDSNGPKPLRAELPEALLRRTLDLYPGEPYSTASIDSATQALLDLEIFSAVTIVPDLSHPETRVVPLAVRLEPSPLRQVRLGGGIEFDEIKTEAHIIAGWEDHNFLGGLRDFTIDLTPGVVLYPTRVDSPVPPTRLFPDTKLRVQLKQPAFIEARTSGFVRPEVNVYPLLIVPKPDSKDPVIGYAEIKGAVGLDRTFLKHLYAAVSFNVQEELPFFYKKDSGDNGAVVPSPIFIAYPDLLTYLDFRDDKTHPHAGIYLQNDLQVADTAFGSTVRDVKIQPEIRTYVPVARRLTFSTRASVGFILDPDYGQKSINAELDQNSMARFQPTDATDVEKVLFRGFFSGGSTTNRGFPLRSIAPHAVVPFLNPATAGQQLAVNCVPGSSNMASAADCGIAIGGLSLWELSNEMRFDVRGPLEIATFCDMGDVGPAVGKLRLDHLHLSCGAGLRYDTPVGPIRLDIGYRIQPLQVLGFPNENAASTASYCNGPNHCGDPTDGAPPTLLGIPIAIAVGIGEAY